MKPYPDELSEELREKNFSVFKSVYGFKPAIDPEEQVKYRMGTAKNGEQVLYIRNAMPGGDLRMNSEYDPGYEASVWAAKTQTEDRKTDVVLCGFSTGIFLKALRQRQRPDTDFYIYEPLEGLFSFVCGYVDLTDIIKNKYIHLFITDKQKATMVDAIQNDIVVYGAEVNRVVTPFYAEDEELKNICDQISRIGVTLRNYKMSRGRDSLRCRLYAWTHMEKARFFTDLQRVFPKGAPAVIVSAGPSLNKNVAELAKMKGHAFILATDRALSTLKEHGIVPDAVISVDAEKSPGYLDYAFEEGMPLICSYQLNSGAQEKCKFPIYFDGLTYEKKLFGDGACSGPAIDMGGNVAGGAFAVLKLLGVETIVLVGQDLAYLDDRHHADDVEDGMGGITEEDCIEITGVYGNAVKTNKMWIKFIDFFERQIKQNPQIRVIDATEGGALIRGTEIMPLSEAAEAVSHYYCDYLEIIRALPNAVSTKQQENALLVMKSWIEELEEINVKASVLGELCKEIAEFGKKKEIDTPDAGKTIQKFDEARNSLYRLEMNSLLEEFWIEDMHSIPGKMLIIDDDEAAVILFEQAGEYYRKLAVDCRGLKEEFINATGRDPSK